MTTPEPTPRRQFTPEQSKALCEIYRILLESQPKPAQPAPEPQKTEKPPQE